VRCLIDSQALLWSLFDQRRLTALARAALADPTNVIFVSPVSPYELEWKKAEGRLTFPDVPDWPSAVRVHGFFELAITLAHSQHASRLPAHHRDPWDRLLVAQAELEGLSLISADRKLPAYGVGVIW